MICQPCKAAGQANANGQAEIAARWHGECESKNCPCQHKTGLYINREALKSK
jgi:hypothetical protein